MTHRESLAALIPHQGAMCLLDRVIAWDTEHVVASTRSHRDPENPLRAGGRLRALHLCEYGAQAMAVHGALVARESGARARPGLLVSLRDVTLRLAYVEDLPGELEVQAQRLVVTAGAWQYTFAVREGEALIAEGRAAIIAGAAPK